MSAPASAAVESGFLSRRKPAKGSRLSAFFHSATAESGRRVAVSAATRVARHHGAISACDDLSCIRLVAAASASSHRPRCASATAPRHLARSPSLASPHPFSVMATHAPAACLAVTQSPWQHLPKETRRSAGPDRGGGGVLANVSFCFRPCARVLRASVEVRSFVASLAALAATVPSPATCGDGSPPTCGLSPSPSVNLAANAPSRSSIRCAASSRSPRWRSGLSTAAAATSAAASTTDCCVQSAKARPCAVTA